LFQLCLRECRRRHPPTAIVIGPRPSSSVERSALRFVTLGSDPRSIRACRARLGRGAPLGAPTKTALHRLHRPRLAGRLGPLRLLRPQLWRTSRPRFCPSCDGWASSCRSMRPQRSRSGRRLNSTVCARPSTPGRPSLLRAVTPHPSQDRRSAALPPPSIRPAGAPALYVRPGPYGGDKEGETFVSSIQALPPAAPSSDATADATALALFSHQLASLQAVQDSQTQVLQELSTLLVAHMPSSVAVPTVPAPPRPTSSSLHQLATLPPACFGTTFPGSCYVAVPAHSTVWLRTDVAEDSMDMLAAADAAASPPPPARRSGSERM